MKAPKKFTSKLPDFFAALLRSHYFPREIPPIITTRYFAEFCKSNYKAIKTEQDYLVHKTTNYETFTAPRPIIGRRNLALVHPLSQLGLSLLICQHRSRISSIISERGTSLYRVSENLNIRKAFLGLDFKTWESRKSKTYSEYPFILQADIARFFYSLYTHSIPWAVVGKAKVKEWLATKNKKKLDAHWSNQFDVALQSCQSRETFGIPVGPDTSRLISEIVLAGMESDSNFSKYMSNRPAFRLIDDFTIGFEDEETARKALAALRSALWKFNLQLNNEKTSVSPSRLLFEAKWQHDFDALPLSNVNEIAQSKDLVRLVDTALHYCAMLKSDAPAIRAAARIARITLVEQNFSAILDVLFRLSREFPRCISHVASFLINHQGLCVDGTRDRVISWVRSSLKLHTPHGHDFEISWCFFVCCVLKIKIRKEDAPPTAATPNAIVLTLLGFLHQKKLLEVPLSKWSWRAHLKKTGVYSENWLPYYEAVQRKWTTDKGMRSAIANDPILSKMLAAKVTVLEDDIVKASQIDLAKGVFKKPSTPTIYKHPTGANWANLPVPESDYD